MNDKIHDNNGSLFSEAFTPFGVTEKRVERSKDAE